MASTATKKRKFTYEDYLKTPDDERYELSGTPFTMFLKPGVSEQIDIRRQLVEGLRAVESCKLSKAHHNRNTTCDCPK